MTTWYSSALKAVQAAAASMSPTFGVVSAAKDFVSEAVAAKIKAEASARAYELLARTHRSVVTTIVVQNAALFASLIPVYLLHSGWPFYVTYAGVAGYSVYTVVNSWPVIRRLVATGSLRETINTEVLLAIEAELTQRQFYERAIVEYLGPDLKAVAEDVGTRLLPDIRAAVVNMTLTLVLAFIAFRLFAIPMLEHRALVG